jgi:hypothetical protein
MRSLAVYGSKDPFRGGPTRLVHRRAASSATRVRSGCSWRPTTHGLRALERKPDDTPMEASREDPRKSGARLARGANLRSADSPRLLAVVFAMPLGAAVAGVVAQGLADMEAVGRAPPRACRNWWGCRSHQVGKNRPDTTPYVGQLLLTLRQGRHSGSDSPWPVATSADSRRLVGGDPIGRSGHARASPWTNELGDCQCTGVVVPRATSLQTGVDRRPSTSFFPQCKSAVQAKARIMCPRSSVCRPRHSVGVPRSVCSVVPPTMIRCSPPPWFGPEVHGSAVPPGTVERPPSGVSFPG